MVPEFFLVYYIKHIQFISRRLLKKCEICIQMLLGGPGRFSDFCWPFFRLLQLALFRDFTLLNIDQVQVVFLFSFVEKIFLKLQIFCEDPRFLLAFGHYPLVQNPNLWIPCLFLAPNHIFDPIFWFYNWLHILDFLKYVVWNVRDGFHRIW